ncbi:MAG: FliI/YscN family ATPase [Deltaproteobacteria bacterium]|nr:FliI/YscN family ATPase [Deltaproteobacteria bacterium]
MGADDARASLIRKRKAVEDTGRARINGRVTRAVGLVMEGCCPGAAMGDACAVHPMTGGAPIPCEVVGFSEERVVLMPLGEVRGVGPGSRIVMTRENSDAAVGRGLLGRVIDGLGRPLDGLGPVKAEAGYPLYGAPRNPLSRRRIEEPCGVGVKAIDALITIGKGQRMGILAGSGVGKSMLLGMMARGTAASVNVIALVGERGREVGEFIEKDLGKEGLKRSVVVAAASDAPALVRIRAALRAAAIAEYFRDQGGDVLFLMDSITRFAAAHREVGLAAGEPPATKGYPPSVFASLPRLMERAGTCEGKGAITGFYTILAEGDDLSDPVADACRAVLDGHITLTRELAGRGHYPAIDVIGSISRVMADVASPAHLEQANRVRAVIAAYYGAYDLISIGAYRQGSDPRVDQAVKSIDRINNFLRQDYKECAAFEDSLQGLFGLRA